MDLILNDEAIVGIIKNIGLEDGFIKKLKNIAISIDRDSMIEIHSKMT